MDTPANVHALPTQVFPERSIGQSTPLPRMGTAARDLAVADVNLWFATKLRERGARNIDLTCLLSRRAERALLAEMRYRALSAVAHALRAAVIIRCGGPLV